ncbi:MAG: hypothetical protein AAF346_06965 [Pseudomonadota bacterium]
MTRDADNDNSTAASRRGNDQVRSWQGMSHGNAALADRLAAEIGTDAASEIQSSIGSEAAVDQPAIEAGLSGGPTEPGNSDFEGHDASVDWSAAPDIPNIPGIPSIPSFDAVPIEVLGIATPHRPIPAARQTQIEPRPVARPKTRRQSHSADLGKQGNAHLFNLPPNAAPAGQPEPSPMEQAINVKPRPPLTSQPGFLAGLVAALVCGGGYYSYLIF